jgi:hypothetical protein
VNREKDLAYVLTSKHNLCAANEALSRSPLGDPKDWGKAAPANTKTLMAEFCKGVTVGEAKAPISRVDFFKEEGDFTYDACLLTVTSAEGLRGFCEHGTIEEDLERAVKTFDRVLQERTKVVLVQFGFGAARKREAPKGTLQQRKVTLRSPTPDTFYSRTVDENVDVLLLNSRPADTTLPGDSGGPLFAVPTQRDRDKYITLLAVTLGADSCKTKEEDIKAHANDDGHLNNAVTSLKRAYQELLKAPKLIGA